MNHKKFSYIFIITMVFFVCFHCIAWQKTKKILAVPNSYQVGDVARLAYDTDIAVVKKLENINLKKRHQWLSGKNPKKVDMLTFGDSFTRGGAGGKNPYFQDYIATYNDLNILHVNNYRSHYTCVQTLLILLNSGYLDKIKPKYIILESAEKYCTKRLAVDLNFNQTDTIKKIEKYYKLYPQKPVNGQTFKKLEFINSGNFKHYLYNFLYKFNVRAFISKVYRFKTNKKIYGKEYALLYKDEIKNAKNITPAMMDQVNNNLNKIGKLLKEKGIQLYFMPVVDKYNLYHNFYLNNPYPKSKFFKLLRQQDNQHYKIIDTDAILEKELKNGTIDLFFYDDTHWTHKASETIFKEMRFEK